ncbi:ferrous iron transport protein A [Lachnospiraceae bacterium NSJ-143]|nr:ferrous iron transport protein A [Lachnospiraceae bacterium NSJ-143]
MMPLTMAKTGDENTIKKIGGKDDVRRFLANLGFVEGVNVKVITAIDGNVIVEVKGSRVAVSRQMAQKIMV